MPESQRSACRQHAFQIVCVSVARPECSPHERRQWIASKSTFDVLHADRTAEPVVLDGADLEWTCSSGKYKWRRRRKLRRSNRPNEAVSETQCVPKWNSLGVRNIRPKRGRKPEPPLLDTWPFWIGHATHNTTRGRRDTSRDEKDMEPDEKTGSDSPNTRHLSEWTRSGGSETDRPPHTCFLTVMSYKRFLNRNAFLYTT